MSTPNFSLAGKVIVQSGGSGLLGRALVSGLAGCGATLVVASRDAAKLEPHAAAERAAAKDPRPSLAERYGDRVAFASKIRNAAKELQRRF